MEAKRYAGRRVGNRESVAHFLKISPKSKAIFTASTSSTAVVLALPLLPTHLLATTISALPGLRSQAGC